MSSKKLITVWIKKEISAWDAPIPFTFLMENAIQFLLNAAISTTRVWNARAAIMDIT